MSEENAKPTTHRVVLVVVVVWPQHHGPIAPMGSNLQALPVLLATTDSISFL